MASLPGDRPGVAVAEGGVAGDEAEITCVAEVTSDPDGPLSSLSTPQPARTSHETAAAAMARCLNLCTFVDSMSRDQELIAIERTRTREAGVAS